MLLYNQRKDLPYKYTTCISRWNDVETVVSTWNTRDVFEGLQQSQNAYLGHCKSFTKDIFLQDCFHEKKTSS